MNAVEKTDVIFSNPEQMSEREIPYRYKKRKSCLCYLEYECGGNVIKTASLFPISHFLISHRILI